MDSAELLKETKRHVRLLDNYFVPETEKVERVCAFFKQVIVFEYQHVKILDDGNRAMFDLLCKDVIRQCEQFLGSEEKPEDRLYHARIILLIILDIELYLHEVDAAPWKIGRKVTFMEKLRLRRIFRTVLHDTYDPEHKRAVRGTPIRVEICGSLAQGKSDWKVIDGNLPKPSDYNLPRDQRKGAVLLLRIDRELMVPEELKSKMSDVDILIMNEVIFDSCNKGYCANGWSYKLGEKYPTGVGASPILEKLHQRLLNAKIGGVRARWINYILLRDQEGYDHYMADRKKQMANLAARTSHPVDIHDAQILNEIVR